MWFTNSNDETLWRFLLVYYTLSEIHCLTQYHDYWHAVLHISTNATSFGCIWIQSPHTIDFHGCTREILGLDGTNGPFCLLYSTVQTWLISTRNRQVIQVYSTIDRAIIGPEDCKPEQQLAHHDDHWRSKGWFTCKVWKTCAFQWSLGLIGWCLSFAIWKARWYDWIGKFELQLTIDDDVYDPRWKEHHFRLTSSPWLKCSAILHSYKKESETGQSSFFLSFFRSISGYNLVCVVGIRDFVLHNVPTDQVVLINAGETIQRDHDFTNAVHTNIFYQRGAYKHRDDYRNAEC